MFRKFTSSPTNFCTPNECQSQFQRSRNEMKLTHGCQTNNWLQLKTSVFLTSVYAVKLTWFWPYSDSDFAQVRVRVSVRVPDPTQSQSQSQVSLKKAGSGKHCWKPTNEAPAREIEKARERKNSNTKRKPAGGRIQIHIMWTRLLKNHLNLSQLFFISVGWASQMK